MFRQFARFVYFLLGVMIAILIGYGLARCEGETPKLGVFYTPCEYRVSQGEQGTILYDSETGETKILNLTPVPIETAEEWTARGSESFLAIIVVDESLFVYRWVPILPLPGKQRNPSAKSF